MDPGLNLTRQLPPAPTYCIAAVSDIGGRTIRDVTYVNPSQQVMPPDNIYALPMHWGRVTTG